MAKTAKFAVKYDLRREKQSPWYFNVPATFSSDGERAIKYFKTEREAKEAASQYKRKARDYGKATVTLPQDIAKQAKDALQFLLPFSEDGQPIGLDKAVLYAVEAWGILQGIASIKEACEHFVAWKSRQSRSVTFLEMVESFKAEKTKSKYSKKYLLQIQSTGNHFIPFFASKMVCEISPADIKDAFHRLAFSDASYAAYRRVLSAIFAHGMEMEWRTDNPIEKVPLVKLSAREVHILEPEQCHALLESAPTSFLPCLILCMFAGLRPTEVERIDWQDINLSKQHVFVKSGANKKERRGRFTKLSNNATAWLMPYIAAEGKVAPSNGRQLMKDTRLAADKTLIANGRKELANLADVWIRDVLRHTAATMMGEIMTMEQACKELGHSMEVHLQHYHKPVERDTAKIFWGLMPRSA